MVKYHSSHWWIIIFPKNHLVAGGTRQEWALLLQGPSSAVTEPFTNYQWFEMGHIYIYIYTYIPLKWGYIYIFIYSWLITSYNILWLIFRAIIFRHRPRPRLYHHLGEAPESIAFRWLGIHWHDVQQDGSDLIHPCHRKLWTKLQKEPAVFATTMMMMMIFNGI